MSDLKDGCVKPAGGPLLPAAEPDKMDLIESLTQEVKKVLARVNLET